MNRLAAIVAASLIGYAILSIIGSEIDRAKAARTTALRRLEFYRREAPRLIAEEYADAS